MVKDHPDPRRLDRKRTPTAEEVMKIGRNLMAALHGAIKVQGILVSCTDVTTLSWHAADGPQLAVLKLWFPSTPSKTFDVEFYAGAGVDFFNGGGFKDRWTFFDEPAALSEMHQISATYAIMTIYAQT